MDFRLGFGAAFGPETELVVIDSVESELPHPRPVAAELYGAVAQTLSDLRLAAGARALASEAWIAALRSTEDERRAAERAELGDDRAPLPRRLAEAGPAAHGFGRLFYRHTAGRPAEPGLGRAAGTGNLRLSAGTAHR